MKTKYFVYDILIQHGEFVDRTLSVLATDQDEEAIIKKLAGNYYGNAKETEYGFEVNGGDFFVNYGDIRQINKQEYDVLKKYAYSEVVLGNPEALDNSKTPIVGDMNGDCSADMRFVGEVGENAYITVQDAQGNDSLTVRIKRELEGVVVDIYSFGEEDGDPDSSCYSFS